LGLTVGIVAESAPGERRVAMAPSALGVLNKSGVEWLLEPGAGEAAGFPDFEYTAKGVRLAGSRAEVFASVDVILQVRGPGANPNASADLALDENSFSLYPERRLRFRRRCVGGLIIDP